MRKGTVMAYFPMFVDISDKKILVVGGGTMAARRIRSLLLFTDEVTVLSPQLCGELEPLPEGVHWIKREYRERDDALAGKDIVLAATNRSEVNKKIFADCRLLEECEGHKILVNCADDKTCCDFFFPAVIQSDEITVGINSGGRNTKKVRAVREKVEEMLKKIRFL